MAMLIDLFIWMAYLAAKLLWGILSPMAIFASDCTISLHRLRARLALRRHIQKHRPDLTSREINLVVQSRMDQSQSWINEQVKNRMLSRIIDSKGD